jgi:hypothetical protein
MTSADTLKDFKSIILTSKEMMDSSAAGGNPVVAFMKSVDKVMSGNKEYQALGEKICQHQKRRRTIQNSGTTEDIIAGCWYWYCFTRYASEDVLFWLEKMGMPEFERQSKLVQTDPVKALETSFGVKKIPLSLVISSA